jgi:Ran GTPase-activating protein (RanGAP) involved in mRNA processing and transport
MKTLLSKLPSLEYLDIRAEPEARAFKLVLSDKGAAQWCEALGKNTKLTHLSMRRHDLGSRAAQYLGKALKKNRFLQHLDLSFNSSFGSGIDQFMEGLRENNTLSELLLSGCKIGNEGAAQLAKLLYESRVIKRLHLTHEALNNDVVELFIQAMERNHLVIDLAYVTLHDALILFHRY